MSTNTFIVFAGLLIAQTIFPWTCLDVGTAVTNLIDVESSLLREKNVGFIKVFFNLLSSFQV
jgi:hypothetical protein